MSRRADALLPGVEDEAPAGRARLDGRALHGGVALVPGEADAGHGPHGQGVQDLALCVQSAGVGERAGVEALPPDAGRLGGAVHVRRAANLID